MSALRLMTFNVQLLPWIADVAGGRTNDAEERADRIADALVGIPASERPDVIALNEVFDNDGRGRLLTRLRGFWPYVVEKVHDGGLEGNSGLMLFSRIPLLPLPTGGNLLESFYPDAEGADALSSKGVGIVQVDHPVARTTIAFTHLQASYDSEDQHRATRVKQLATVRAALESLLGPAPGPGWERTIVVGDLNVRGDSAALTDEWASVFDQRGSELTEVLSDGWRTTVHPPGDDRDHDPGVTHIEWATGTQQRLDYQLFAMYGDRALVPHHMQQRLRNSSDHFSLESVVQQVSEHCQPATAIELATVPPLAGGGQGKPSTVHRISLQFQHPGAFQWVWVERPGTFTFWNPPDLEIRVFAQSDITRPLAAQGSLVTAKLSTWLPADQRRSRVNPRGTTYSSPEPFYVAVQCRNDGLGSRTLFVLHHHGESRETAIVLTPHHEVSSSFVPGTVLGDDDQCWFIATLPRTLAGTPHEEVFQLSNPGRRDCQLEILDSGLTAAGKGSGVTDPLVVPHTTRGDETIHLVLTREGVQDAGMALRWVSPVSYLALDRPVGLFIDDETGTDFWGADEVELSIQMDGVRLFDGFWDDADTGERWPGLAERITANASTAMPGARRIGFSDYVKLGYLEADVNAAAWQVAFVPPIDPTDPDMVQRTVKLPVSDITSDGTYTFYCSLSRTP